MDIETKKTVLDDDASIYQKRKESYTGKDVKNFSFKEKILYFKDYYFKISIVALIIIIAAGILIKDIIFDRSSTALYVSCVNECQISGTKELTDELSKVVTYKREKDYVSVVNYDLEMTQFNMSFVTMLNAGTIDLVVCPEDYFEEAASSGNFKDLSYFLSKEDYEALSDRMVTACIKDVDPSGNVDNIGDPQPFGIDISDTKYFSECTSGTKRVILCVAYESMQPENAIAGIKYITGIE